MSVYLRTTCKDFSGQSGSLYLSRQAMAEDRLKQHKWNNTFKGTGSVDPYEFGQTSPSVP